MQTVTQEEVNCPGSMGGWAPWPSVNLMKTQTLILTAALLFSSLAVFGIPSVSAHTCHSQDDSCNEPCASGDAHDHRWVDNNGQSQSCYSSGPDTLEPCDVYAILALILDPENLDFFRPPPCPFGSVFAAD